VEARRAFEPEGGGSSAAGDEERLARVGVACDGTCHLAYLVRRSGWTRLELRVAPLAAGASDGGPQAVPPGRRAAEGCLAMAPAFSPDGRWVHTAVPDGRDGVRVERFGVSPPEAAASGPTPGE
jgi:hypothetical protein